MGSISSEVEAFVVADMVAGSFFATVALGWMRFGWDVVPPWTGPTPDSEKNILQGRAEFLQSQLDDIKERLVALAKEKSE